MRPPQEIQARITELKDKLTKTPRWLRTPIKVEMYALQYVLGESKQFAEQKFLSEKGYQKRPSKILKNKIAA